MTGNDWALKDAQGPRNEDMHYQENVQKQYRALRRKGYNTDIINMEHDLSQYRLLTVPMAYMFYHGYAEKLRTFAKNGGTLVLSYWSGIVDETDKCYLEGTPHGLMEAAGIRTEEIDALYDWEENVGCPETGNHLRLTESYICKNFMSLAKVSDAEVLRYGRDFYQGYPVLTQEIRKGPCLLCGGAIWSCLFMRTSGKGSRGSRREDADYIYTGMYSL